jgi:hypothetical protein
VNLKRIALWLVGAVGLLAAVVAPAGARGGGGSGSTACGNGTVTWSPAVVWPPNHKLVPITISWNETDAISSDSNTLSADSVTSVGVDDKGAGQPSSKQGPDYSGVPTTSSSVSDGSDATVTVYVRAERSGTDKAGRTYMINLTCKSGDDVDGHATAIVTVPHDMGNNSSGSNAPSNKSKSTSTQTALPTRLSSTLL